MKGITGGEKNGKKLGILGIFGNEVIGAGNLYSGYSGVPGGSGGNGRSSKPGKVSRPIGDKSFRVATAECMLESNKLMMKKPTTNKRENAISEQCEIEEWVDGKNTNEDVCSECGREIRMAIWVLFIVKDDDIGC